MLNSLLCYSVVSNILILAVHVPADDHISCSPWFQTDSWLAVFSAIIIDGKVTNNVNYLYFDSVYSNDFVSYMGYLEEVQEYFDCSQCSSDGKRFVPKCCTHT